MQNPKPTTKPIQITGEMIECAEKPGNSGPYGVGVFEYVTRENALKRITVVALGKAYADTRAAFQPRQSSILYGQFETYTSDGQQKTRFKIFCYGKSRPHLKRAS